MFKKVFFIIFCIFISCTAVFAETVSTPAASTDLSEFKPAVFLEKIKYHRADIYNSLELSLEQVKKIEEIDNKFYEDIEPELKNLAILTKKLNAIALSGSCTKKDVNNIKKEFRVSQKEMNSTKNKYDKEFVKVLNAKQKSKYRTARKQKRAEMKKECKKLKTEQIKQIKKTP